MKRNVTTRTALLAVSCSLLLVAMGAARTLHSLETPFTNSADDPAPCPICDHPAAATIAAMVVPAPPSAFVAPVYARPIHLWLAIVTIHTDVRGPPASA